MLRRSWIPIVLFLLACPLLAQTPPKPAPDRTKEDCAEACIRKATPCYDKCSSTLKRCRAEVRTKCAKSKNADAKAACLSAGNDECRDEKEINCDPQCSAHALICIHACEPGSK